MGYELTVMGASLGGLNALTMILAGLPKRFPIAIAIAQHRHRFADGELATFLRRQTELPILEVEDKQRILAGQVYLAPADYHLLVEPGYFSLSTEAPVAHARPSIDVLFETAADAYVERLIGLILTGASSDGAEGLAKVQARGGLALVQAPETAENRAMPKAAIAAVPTAKILPLNEIAPFLTRLGISSASLTPNCIRGE